MNFGSQAIRSWVPATLFFVFSLAACADPGSDEGVAGDDGSLLQALVDQYAIFRLEADLSHLSENDRQVVRLLIEAVQPMDGVFWQQAYGDKEAALALAGGDEATRRFIEINYGPWDRLRGDGPFVDGVGDKPAGANFYPADMTPEELEAAAAENEALRSLYTLVRRDDDGTLVAHPYHEAFAEAHVAAAAKLREAAELASNPGLAHYLMLRADALETDDYQRSDMAWLDMKDNPIDVIIGPVETYEDQMLGAKAAHEGFVLIKDMEWSERLARFADLLPSLQQSLPVPGRVQGGDARHGLRPERLRRRLLFRRRQRGCQDDRDQPPKRRSGPTRQGDSAAPAQERHAGQIRQDHGRDRGGADRRGPAALRRL